MALTPPTVTDLGKFRGEAFATSGDENQYASAMLQQATDALWIFTGITDYPTDTQQTRVMKNAIMDLTLWLLSQAEHRDEINSPFSSERIGSYSYSKMRSAWEQKSDSGSGIYWLDMLFRMLKGEDDQSFSTSSENIFDPSGEGYFAQRFRERARMWVPADLDPDFYEDPSRLADWIFEP